MSRVAPAEPGGYADSVAHLAELGLAPPVTFAQIKAAYRERSRALHPDRNAAPDAAEAMARVNEAYRALEGYVQSFRYQIDESEYLTQRPRERIRRQFENSDQWGKNAPPRKRR